MRTVPLLPLKVAAGSFGDPQGFVSEDWEWVAVDTSHSLRRGMFVAQVVGQSMEPLVPDGSYCLFASPVTGSRQGRVVLVELLEADPETGQRYTVKRYRSQKAAVGDAWQHTRITLDPANPAYSPIVIEDVAEGSVQVIAEFIEALGTDPPS